MTYMRLDSRLLQRRSGSAMLALAAAALLQSQPCGAQTFRYGTISWQACGAPFVDPYFPHVCRTSLDASGAFATPDRKRIAVTVHAAWSRTATTESTMVNKDQAQKSWEAFQASGPPTRLELSRLQDQPRFERRIGYRRAGDMGDWNTRWRSSTLATAEELAALCVTGDDPGNPACNQQIYGFMIDRMSPDSELFHARYTFEIAFATDGDYEVFFEGCCRLLSVDNNANLPFYLSTQVQLRQGAPRASAHFAHPETVVLRRDGDHFITDGEQVAFVFICFGFCRPASRCVVRG